jgi:hypothetical protein
VANGSSNPDGRHPDPRFSRVMKRTRIFEAFPTVGFKMTFLFDYGDNWQFRIEAIGQYRKEPGANIEGFSKALERRPISARARRARKRRFGGLTFLLNMRPTNMAQCVERPTTSCAGQRLPVQWRHAGTGRHRTCGLYGPHSLFAGPSGRARRQAVPRCCYFSARYFRQASRAGSRADGCCGVA